MLKTFQQGRTNLLDGDKALFGIGAMMTIHNLGARPRKAPWLRALRFGGGFNVQDVLPYTQTRRSRARRPLPAIHRGRARTRRSPRAASATPGFHA